MTLTLCRMWSGRFGAIICECPHLVVFAVAT
jgi:hypothetical protein